MNETLETQRNIKFSHQPKLFGLPGSITGALIGVVLFVVVYLVSNAAGFEILPTLLVAPGFLVYFTVGSISAIQPLDDAIFFGISSIPFAVLGCLFGPKNKGLIVIGIALFIMYSIVSTVIALGIYAVFAADY